MDEAEARRKFQQARVARLATADVSGRPHAVPLVFAVEGDRIYSAVDAKPKRSHRLKRLANVAANPRVSMIVDHYAEDWSALWWVRADGSAQVIDDGPMRERAITLLRAKYPQYHDTAGFGPAVVITVDHWTGWSVR